MQQYEIFTFIICLAAFFSFINHVFIRLTPSIGMMALSVFFSLLLLAGRQLFPAQAHQLISVIGAFNFRVILLQVMLGFLLFAGAMQIDAESLKKERLPIIVLATVGTFISTAVVGAGMFYIFPLVGMSIPLLHCLLFAALISPTDPIAVLSILKTVGLPKSLELKIAGESLFNDGVAVVFLTCPIFYL